MSFVRDVLVEGFFTTQERNVLAQVPLLVGEHGQPFNTVDSSRRTARQVEFAKAVTGCLKEARIRQRERPFDLGETVVEFFAELGLIDAGAEEGLGRFVDGMYFTLYESTRKKRRLHHYLGDDRLTIVDRVQRIRNRLFRHAIEQEQPIALVHQGPELLADLQAIGVNALPNSVTERLALHDGVLDSSISLLAALREAIRT